MKSIEELLAESEDLQSLASKIQGEKQPGPAADRVRELTDRYLAWFAECVATLPEDLAVRFRSEYEGSFFASKIKQFLPGALTVAPLWKPELEGNPLIQYWQNPFERTFQPAVQAQRLILLEAQRRNPLTEATSSALRIVEGISRRFGRMVRRLNDRRADRPGLAVRDEYDVQDLMGAVLAALFEDVRDEEPTPSRAGAASRIDFLLKQEQVVVETKMTRVGLGAKEVGAELLIDIGRYRAHPDCKALSALVYDPERRIANPSALENDLSGANSGMIVQVVVCQD